jgi:DNA (cytosine-5)-methyltransferase 1
MNVSTGTHFKLLDLYCGEGLAAWGYWLSSRFSEIVGVDLDPEMSTKYSFDFLCANALSLDYEFLSQFDFIHASPPCQAYSKATPDKSRHMRLIAATHLMLHAAGKPYVIENVEGSGIELRPNLVANGLYFGLSSDRRRYFHVSTLKTPLRRIMSAASAGHKITRIHGGTATRAELIDAMGLGVIPEKRRSFLTVHGIEQGVPPAFTRHIAELVIRDKFLIA